MIIAAIVVGFYLFFFLGALMFGASMIPMSSAFMDDPGSAAAVGIAGMMAMFLFMTMAVIGGVYLQTIWFFVYPFICTGKLSCGDAMRMSRKVVMKNFWWIVLFSILVGMVSGVGIYALFVGILLTYPLKYILALGAYINIVGLGDKKAEL